MSVNDDELRAVVAHTMVEAEKLLNGMRVTTDTASEGMLILIAALAIMARAVNMPLGPLLEGVEAAYLSFEEVGTHVKH
jgi:hypothetical protein